MAPDGKHRRLDGIELSMRCCSLGLHTCIRVRPARTGLSLMQQTDSDQDLRLDCAERTCNPVARDRGDRLQALQTSTGRACQPMSSPNSSLQMLQLRLQLQLRAFESQPVDLTLDPLSMRTRRCWDVGTADRPDTDAPSQRRVKALALSPDPIRSQFSRRPSPKAKSM
ncbi:uncharacterized protein TrAFT101_007569 [Trichoderma asperellum]|nr:hypothetical protein TrAFT101_007569 [Trichoderma asperellum]